jgi:bromodomain adjacent to zinc finger domain protein 1A
MASLLEDIKEENPASNNSTEEDIIMQDCSELSDVSEMGSESTSAAVGKKSARQKDLRIKTQTIAHSKEREAARMKQAAQKQAMAEHRRVDEEVNKIERRLEGIEREFRRLLGGVRVKPLGRDRFFNRIWWFDGMGSASLVGSGGTALYGSGRLFIQGPSEFDDDILQKRQNFDHEDIHSRRLEEEGKDGILGPNEWAVYNDLDEVCFISLLFR